MKKKLVSCILVVCMLLTMLPTMAWAEGEVPPVEPTETPVVEQPEQQEQQMMMSPAPVAEPVVDGKLDIANGSIVITATGYTQGDAAEETAYEGDYVISQADAATATPNTITVNGGNPTITLAGVNISAGNPITIASGQKVTLNLSGESKLTTSVEKGSGILAKSAEVTINGTNADTLTINASGNEGVGINGSNDGKITIDGGTFNITSNGNSIGRAQSGGNSTVIINDGVFTLSAGKGGRAGIHCGIDGGTFTLNGGTLKKISAKNNNYIIAGTVVVNGGNVSDYYSGVDGAGADSNSRKLAKLHVVDANGAYLKNTEVTVNVNSTETWKAYTDSNGVITTYLPANDEAVTGINKVTDGIWLVGGACTCNPTAFDWSDTVSTAKVYSTDVTIPVPVTVNKCGMPIHKVGDVTWEITDGGENAVKNGDGTLTLKTAASGYVVKLKATLGGTTGLTNDTHTITVTADNTIKSIDIAKGIVVASAGMEGKTKYTQYSGTSTTELSSFEATATEKVYIYGTYSAAATPIIDITGGTPNIVLSGLNIKNTNNDCALRVTASVATITLEGENTIASGAVRNTIGVASGAKLIIDSAAGTVGLDSVVDKFKDDHNVTIEQTKYAGTLNMGTIVGPGDVIIKGGNIVSDVDGYAFYSISNLEITGGNIYVVRNRPNSVWADNLTITSGTVFAKVVNTSDKTGENYDTSYRTAISGNTLTLGTEGDDANAKKLYIYADNSKCNGAAIGGHYDCTVNIHSGVIIADASGNGNACAIGIGNASDKDDTPVANINITGGDISAIGPEPYVVDNGDGTSYVQMVTSIGSRGNSQSNSGGVNGQGVISITGGTISTNGTIGTSMCNQDRDAVRNGEMTVEEAKALFAGSSLTISGDATVKQTSDIAPATIAQGYYDTAISGDASVAGVELPEGVDSVTFSANAPWNLKANTDGTVTLPEGTTVTKDDGSSVELSNKATMAADGTITTSGVATITKEDNSSVELSNGGTIAADGTITAGGTVTTKDSDGNVVSTVVVPEDKTATVDADGKVTAPAGTKVTVGDKETTLTNGGTVSADGTVKKNYVGGGYYTPPVSADVDNSSLNNAAQAVGSAINNGSAEMEPATGYTKEEIAKLQKEGKLNLAIEKKSGYASVADKNAIDAAIAKAGGAVVGTSVLYFDITPVLKTDDGKVVATVTDTEKPLTITLDLSAELQKAAKDGKHIAVVRCHDGKATFIDGKLNAAKTQITFSSSDFSTYAVVALDKQTSAQTFDAGIVVYGAMAVLAATGSAVVIGKKRRAE